MTIHHIAYAAMAVLIFLGGSLPAQDSSGVPAGRTAPESSGRQALLIGIDDYAAIRDLCYCRRDMEALQQRLIQTGFPADRITLMHDEAESAALRPLRANIERELARVLEAAGRSDVVLVAFAGHGVLIDGTSYLCPIEARFENPKETMLAMQSVYGQLAAAPARLRLLVVDACRNDPSPGGVRSIERPTKTLDGFAQSLQTPPEGVLLLASCRAGQISNEDDDCRHGVFMHYLMRGLEGEADRQAEGNFDDRVSLLELYNYAATHTKTHVARSRNLVQTPVLYGTLTGDYDLVAALPHRPCRLPSRFYRIGGEGRLLTRDFSTILMSDPFVITAADPKLTATLREIAEYLFTSYGNGVPRVVCRRAIDAADATARQEPDNPFAPLIRAEAYRILGDYEKALNEFNKVEMPLVVEVNWPEMPNRRVERPQPGADDYYLVEVATDDGQTKEIRAFDKARIVEVRGDMLRFDAVLSSSDDEGLREESGWLPAKYVKQKLFLKTSSPDFALKYHIVNDPDRHTREYWYRKPGFVDRHQEVVKLLLGGRKKDELDEYAKEQSDQISDNGRKHRLQNILQNILQNPLRQRVPPEDLGRAVELCNEALELDPGNEIFLALRGVARRKLRDFEGALADFKAVDLPLLVNFKDNNPVPLRVGKKVTAEPYDSEDLLVTRIDGDWLWVDLQERRRDKDVQGYVRQADVE